MDIFVVFPSESDLNSHLLTKHKVKGAIDKLTNFTYDSSSHKYRKKDLDVKKNFAEFNFSEYVKKLKENMEYYVKNKLYLQDKKYEIQSESSKLTTANTNKHKDSFETFGNFDKNYKYDKENKYYDYYGTKKNPKKKEKYMITITINRSMITITRATITITRVMIINLIKVEIIIIRTTTIMITTITMIIIIITLFIKEKILKITISQIDI